MEERRLLLPDRLKVSQVMLRKVMSDVSDYTR